PRCEGSVVVGLSAGMDARCTVDVASAEATCLWPDVAMTDCALAGARCDAGACVDYPRLPAVGEAIISELMVIPATSESGEWLEIANPGDVALELAGCELLSGG